MKMAIPPTEHFQAAEIRTCTTYFFLAVLMFHLYKYTYNLFFHPLASFPGPLHWRISRLPSQLSILRGHNHLDILSLHQTYGPVVRIGPNELAFNTAQAFRDIYGLRRNDKKSYSRFKKDQKRYTIPPNGANHILTAADDEMHARHRRLLGYAFGERAVREQEGLVRGYVDTLIARLSQIVDEDGTGRGKVDMKNWLNYTTFDITGDLMFGESFECLENSQLHPWVQMLFDSVKAVVLMGAVAQWPWLNWALMKLIPRSVMKNWLDHFELAARKVDKRLESKDMTRPDFMSHMLRNGLAEEGTGHGLDEKVMSRAEIHSNAFILIVAGSETSATCLSGCVYFLCTHDSVVRRLVQEVRGAFGAMSEMSFASTSKLPYLNAVIEESLRLYPPFSQFLMRTSMGDEVDGHWVPKGTNVATHHYASYHSSSNFYLPDEFIPERWLGSDKRFENDKKDALNPFSLGPRNCLGKSLGYAEIRLILCRLLFSFDMELCPESRNWTDQEVYFLWDRPALMVKLSHRK